MSSGTNEVNRDIDAQTAEGHAAKRRPARGVDVPPGETSRRVLLEDAEGLDDPAEGHMRARR